MTLLISRISDTENYGIGLYNTGINTADIYSGIPVFGIPVLEALFTSCTQAARSHEHVGHYRRSVRLCRG